MSLDAELSGEEKDGEKGKGGRSSLRTPLEGAHSRLEFKLSL